MFTLVKLLYFKIGQRMRWHKKFCPPFCTLLLTLITPLLVNIFSKKFASSLPSSIPRKLYFSSFISFSIVWVTSFNAKIFQRLNYFYDFFHIFVWYKWGCCSSIFFTNRRSTFINDTRNLTRGLPDCMIFW